jgi:hypothetical protein
LRETVSNTQRSPSTNMSESQQTLDRTKAEPLLPSASRRHLLKAAASAPVIATLPGTAAFAASIHQCLIDAAKAPQDGIKPWILAGSNPYVRVGARGSLYINNDGTEGAYVIGIPRPTPTTWYLAPGNPKPLDQLRVPNAYDGSQWREVTPSDYGSGWTESQHFDLDVLVLFNITDGHPENGFNFVGVWPTKAKVTDEAFGVPQSCLCSVDPGAQYSAYCS